MSTPRFSSLHFSFSPLISNSHLAPLNIFLTPLFSRQPFPLHLQEKKKKSFLCFIPFPRVLSSLPPFIVDFLRERSSQGPCTFASLYSLPCMIPPSPLFSSYPLKLISNLLITRLSTDFFSVLLLTASYLCSHSEVLARNPCLSPLNSFSPRTQ